MQQEKYCAAAALSLLAPRPLTSWGLGLHSETGTEEWSTPGGKAAHHQSPSTPRAAPAASAFEIFQDNRR